MQPLLLSTPDNDFVACPIDSSPPVPLSPCSVDMLSMLDWSYTFGWSFDNDDTDFSLPPTPPPSPVEPSSPVYDIDAEELICHEAFVDSLLN